MEQFENGTKSYNGITPVVDLNGSWYEMGRQYGALLKGELQDVYENMLCRELFEKSAFNADRAKAVAQKLYANYPYRLKQFFAGMQETAELSLDKLQLINAIEFLLSRANLQPGCSGIAVWGDYAADCLVYGRNYDYFMWLKNYAKNIALAAFHPSDGALSTVIIGFAGEIYAVNGMNEKGIFLELNNAMPSGGSISFENRVPSVVKLFEFLLDAATLDEMEVNFETTKASSAYIVGVSDGQVARCYEWPTFGLQCRKSHTRPGLTVLTNHFTAPSWGLPRPEDSVSFATCERRENLLALAKHFKGAIDAKVMKDIIDSAVDKVKTPAFSTIYQIVTEPSKFTLSLRIPGVQDWTEFELKALLRPKED